MLTNADITLYSRRMNLQTKQAGYISLVIEHVSWYSSCDVTAVAGGLVSSDTYRIRIPEKAFIDGKPALDGYLSPSDYQAEPEGHWTVENGDYFCLGKGPEIDKPSDLGKYHLIYGQVRSLRDNRRGGLPHIRIEGWR